ncbi:YHYH protein [Curvibacter sp. APW13]|uniref:YHYH protein n=1 Tax=Curvibacter sp. APW13 TaxID=3077236 RepID=UPI0028DE7309|nr:YHYH protein [Curvibacter sp. APW13]MDT8991946.1 YHYH protein [Curvibacter sp. APW13]
MPNDVTRSRRLATVLLPWLALQLVAPVSHAHDAGDARALDPRALPLGDGKISHAPQAGHVWACRTPMGGGGAHAQGPWIAGSTWDSTRKAFVAGDVAWTHGWLDITLSGAMRSIGTNGVPASHGTGTFPIARSDPAYQWDRNPNTITPMVRSYTVAAMPALAAQASCLPMGAIGVMLDGVAVFNALDGEGRDAVAHEVQDRCNGHPERSGQYHYHGPSPCIPGAQDRSRLLGYALDGFGIYSMFDENGRELTNADLDECHGRTSKVLWDGTEVVMYHYVLTREYPYTVGCFRGTPSNSGAGGPANGTPTPRPGMPPAGFGPRRMPW